MRVAPDRYGLLSSRPIRELDRSKNFLQDWPKVKQILMEFPVV
jgi:hypothetical protein